MAKIVGRKIKVSVLVPIYNVETFLPECLDSLVNQTLKELEIICINDGSTDGSPKIIKEYAKNDPRIVIIDKKNTGYGDSMNQGLDKAMGEYIGIVEPDDFIELDAFRKMYKLAKENDAEVVKANFYEYKTMKKRDIYKSNLFLKEETGRIINPRSHRHIFYQQPSIWSAIYKRDFLNENKIRFLPSEGASYQDAGFTFKVWARAKRVIFIDEAFLHYRKDNPNSSVKSTGKIFAVKDEYDEVENYLNNQGLMEVFGPTLATVRMGGYIWNMRRLEKTAARSFAEIVKKDYNRYKKMGYLELGNFNDRDAIYIADNLIIKKPIIYLSMRPLYEGWDKIKRWGFKIIKKNRKSDTISS